MTRRRTTLGLIPVILALGLAIGVVAARSGTAGTTAKRMVVRTADNPTLDRKVLVNRKGFTLYSLSAERRGRFICTDSFCLSLWTPLVVPSGATPTGASRLDTVRRPDGRTQVTYRGLPLYTFSQDRKPGDVKGNGFRDVGIWRPAFPSPRGGAVPPPADPYPGPPGYGG